MRYLFALVLLILAGCRPVIIEEHHREPPRTEVIIERPAPQPVIIERREEPRREIIVEPRRIEIEIGHDHH
jgi:hypothetical protein